MFAAKPSGARQDAAFWSEADKACQVRGKRLDHTKEVDFACVGLECKTYMRIRKGPQVEHVATIVQAGHGRVGGVAQCKNGRV